MTQDCDVAGHWHHFSTKDGDDHHWPHGLFGCVCVDGCSRCEGTGYLMHFSGDERDQILDEWWIANNSPEYPAAAVRLHKSEEVAL